MEGVNFPSLKSVSLSILAYGSLGFGSLGVPSTLAHLPIVLPQPTILFNTQLWSYRRHSQFICCILCYYESLVSIFRQSNMERKWHELTCKVAPWRMMDSLTRTPAPIVTPVPMDTFGPNWREKKHQYNMVTSHYRLFIMQMIKQVNCPKIFCTQQSLRH